MARVISPLNAGVAGASVVVSGGATGRKQVVAHAASPVLPVVTLVVSSWPRLKVVQSAAQIVVTAVSDDLPLQHAANEASR